MVFGCLVKIVKTILRRELISVSFECKDSGVDHIDKCKKLVNCGWSNL